MFTEIHEAQGKETLPAECLDKNSDCVRESEILEHIKTFPLFSCSEISFLYKMLQNGQLG